METQETIQFEEYYSPHRTWFSVRVYPSSSGVSVYFQDINQRKSWEEQIKKQVTQQTAMKEILRMALEGVGSTELQQEMAKLSANAVDMKYCRISKYDPDRDKMILSASYGFENSKIGEPLDSEKENQIKRSYHDRDLITVNDYIKSGEFERTREQEYLGVRSSISTFIGEYEDPWGVISFYSQKVRNFSDSEKEFVQSLASALGTVIENQNQRIKLQEYKEAINSLDKGVYLTDNQSRFLFTNSAFKELTGYTGESLEGEKIDIIGGEDISDGQGYIRTFEGDDIWVKASFSPVKLPNGTYGKLAVIRNTEEK
jgi:GAF domain-containing protein